MDCGVQDPGTGKTVYCPKHDINIQGLLAGVITVKTDFDLGSLGYVGLEALTTEACYSKGIFMECPDGRATAPIDQSKTICSLLECSGFEWSEQVIHLSYWFSLKQLWELPGPGRDPPGCNYWKECVPSARLAPVWY